MNKIALFPRSAAPIREARQGDAVFAPRLGNRQADVVSNMAAVLRAIGTASVGRGRKWRLLLAAVVVAGASVAVAASRNAAIAQSACQTRLEAAVLKITSSGPVRIVDTASAGTDLENIKTMVFVPPHSFQSSYAGRMWAGIKAPSTVMVGEMVYSGSQRIMGQLPTPIPNPIYGIGELEEIANPLRYFAKSCAAARIVLHHEMRGSLDPTFAVREAALKQLEAESRSQGQDAETVEPSELDLDGQGRPIRLKFGNVRSRLADLLPPANRVVIFTYDATLRVEAPK